MSSSIFRAKTGPVQEAGGLASETSKLTDFTSHDLLFDICVPSIPNFRFKQFFGAGRVAFCVRGAGFFLRFCF